MRIGIDGRELLSQRTGVGRYLAALCENWGNIELPYNLEFVLYTPTQDPSFDLQTPFNTVNSHTFTLHHIKGRPSTWWEQVQLPAIVNNDALDVFFSPAYSAPLRLNVPTVVTMHDVSFAAHPEWFHWREGARRRFLAQQTMTNAQAVIAVSNFSRDEILRHFTVPPTRIHVVHSGIEGHSVKAGDTNDPLILYVGSIFNRRNLPTLLRALKKVRAHVSDARLVIVGNNRTYPQEDLPALATELGVIDSVSFRAYVSDHQLAALYSRARVFAFLSEYEGFGLTPLEALAAHVPIVVGDTAVARELYANAALYVQPDNPTAVADALVALLTNVKMRDRQEERAVSLLPYFDWTRAAGETLTILTQAAHAHK